MSSPPSAGIHNQEFNSVFKTLNFFQRQLYSVVSVLIGGVIGSFTGIVIGGIFSLMTGKSNFTIPSTVSGLVCGALLLGIICTTNHMFDVLGYAFHTIILIVLLPIFVLKNFSPDFLNLTPITIIILAILLLLIKEKRFFVDFQIRMLHRIIGNRISAKG